MAKKVDVLFSLTSGVGITSTPFAGKIMDSHLKRVINRELIPLIIENLNKEIKDWQPEHKPTFRGIDVEKTTPTMWTFGVYIPGRGGVEKSPRGTRITPKALYEMLDTKGRPAPGRKQAEIKGRSYGLSRERIGGVNRLGKERETFRKGKTTRQPLIWKKNYSSGLYGGGHSQSGQWRKQHVVKQGPIIPRQISRRVTERLRKNKDIKRAVDRGYRRALDQIKSENKEAL